MDSELFFLHSKSFAKDDSFGVRKLNASVSVTNYNLTVFASDAHHLPGVAYYENVRNPKFDKALEYQAYVTSFDSEGGDVNTAIYLHGELGDGTNIYIAFDNEAYEGKMVPAFVEHSDRDGYAFLMEDIYRFKQEVKNEGIPINPSQKEFDDIDISIDFYKDTRVFSWHLPAMIEAVPKNDTAILFHPGWKKGDDSALTCSGEKLYRYLKAVFADGPVYPTIDNLDDVPTPGSICD